MSEPQTLEYEPAKTKLFRAGTLVYTQQGLFYLFFCLLGGDFTWQLRDRCIAPSMPLLLRKFGGSDFMAGLLLGTLPPLMGILLSPIISYRSDRHRGRWGRRIPFLLIPTPIVAISMIALAFSPVVGRWIHNSLGHDSPGLDKCVVGVFAFFWTIFEVAAITINSVHGALVNDVVPRPVMGRFFGLFRVLSLIAGIFFSYQLLGKVENHYVSILVAIGLIYGVCFSVMCLLVKEGDYPPPAELPPHRFGPLGAAIETYARDCFTHPYYLWYFLSYMLAFMAFSPINLFSLYYAQSVGMSMDTYGKFGALQLFCSMVQAPIIGWLSDKFHPIRITIFALFMYAGTTLLAFFFVRNAAMFAAAHVICGTCSGMWLTASAPLSPLLLPKMKFATFASALGIFSALGTIITAPIVGELMDWLNHGRPANARDYHWIYLWASVFIFLSTLVMLIVYRYFMAYGGPRDYVAPDTDVRKELAVR